MVTTFVLYTILILSTCCVLTVICSISLQQYCVSDFFDKPRLKRILSALLFISLSLILNLLIYLARMYPNYMYAPGISLELTWCAFEAVYVIIAFHVFRIFHIWSIRKYYDSINLTVPKWHKYFFNILQLTVILMVLICYPFIFIFNDTNWSIRFYIFVAFVIFVEAIFTLANLRRMSNLFKHSQKNKSIQFAKRYIRTIRLLTALICSYSAFQTFMCIQILMRHPIVSFNHQLGVAMTHSFLFIVLGILLIVWIYQWVPWCGCCGHISDSSVCIVYGCEGFCWFWNYLCFCCGDYEDGNGDEQTSKTSVLLKKSTVNINVSRTLTHTTDVYVTIDETENHSIQDI